LKIQGGAPVSLARNSAAAEKNWNRKARAGKNSFPPNPLPFCPPERLDFKIQNSDFRQKMFELRPKNTRR